MLKKVLFLALIALSYAAKKPKFQTWLICGNNYDYRVDTPLTGIE
jgi:hypothetical protein